MTYAVTVAGDLQQQPLVDPAETLAAWLDARGLRHGYGPYWDASIVTASGRGRVAVRPVWVRAISPQTHSIESMWWMADKRWFSEGPATFVVFEPAQGRITSSASTNGSASNPSALCLRDLVRGHILSWSGGMTCDRS